MVWVPLATLTSMVSVEVRPGLTSPTRTGTEVPLTLSDTDPCHVYFVWLVIGRRTCTLSAPSDLTARLSVRPPHSSSGSLRVIRCELVMVGMSTANGTL